MLDSLHGMRRPTSEANNFGFYYAQLCHEVSNALFYYSEGDVESIDNKLLDGSMTGKFAGRLFRGSGTESDKLKDWEIKALKKVTFNETTGKKEGGAYWDTTSHNVRKYLRKPEVIKRRLLNVASKFKMLDKRREEELGRKHRHTMTDEVEKALKRLAENAPHLYDVGDPYQPDGRDGRGLPKYIAARGTNFTETINSLFPVIMRGGARRRASARERARARATSRNSDESASRAALSVSRSTRRLASARARDDRETSRLSRLTLRLSLASP